MGKNIEKKKSKQDKTQNKSIIKKRKIKQDTNNFDTIKNTKLVKFTEDTIDNEILPDEKQKKRKALRAETRAPTDEEILESELPENKKNIISKRKLKKERHEKLQAEQKIKSQGTGQKKALNYLSRWKHSRNDWKFEKLRQVWLQHHKFDTAAIPEEQFDTLVEYFSGAKGQIKQFLINDCKKIVDDTNAEENDEVKFNRARKLLQFLQ